MPTLDEIIKEKMERLTSVPDAMVTASNRAQQNMLIEAERLIAQMDIEDGKFVFSDKNIQLITQISNQLEDVIIDEPYIESLTKFAREFNTQAKINNSYFYKIIDTFEPQSVYNSTLKIAQQNAVTLLSQDAVTDQIISPIKNTLLSSVTNGGSFNDTMNAIREVATNTEASDGLLTRYVKRVAYDAYAVADRQYTKVISEDLGLEFYKFQGGHLEDSRCFCDERKGGYYHKKEIEAWGVGKGVGKCGFPWQGMNANTNSDTIFSFVGGYRCVDNLLPTIISRVPKEWIQRAVNLGYYKN